MTNLKLLTRYAILIAMMFSVVTSGLMLTASAQTTSPNFSISANPSSITIPAGTSYTSVIKVTSTYRFSGTVALTRSSPSGITEMLAASSLSISPSAPSKTTNLSISVASTTPAGTYKILVNATSGLLWHALNVTVYVIRPDFSMSANPSYLTIPAGTFQTSSIKVVSQSKFNGTVTISASSIPGITTGFSSSSVLVKTGVDSPLITLTVGVPSTTTAGTYKLAVNGVSAVLSHSINVTVNVIKPDFSIGASPASLTIPIGTSLSTTVRVASLSRFNGTVSLTSGAPAGTSASLSLSSLQLQTVTIPNATTTITIAVSSNVAPGSYKVLVTGTSGSISHSVNITVNALKPDFSIGAAPSSLTIPVGTTLSTTVKLTSQNKFNGTVSLTKSAPVGISAALTSSPFTLQTVTTPSATATLTITVPSSTAAGTYKILVTGVSGSLSHSVTVNVCVIKPDFSVGANPSSFSIAVGTTQSISVSASSLSKFNGTVALTMSALPSGLTASLGSSSLAVNVGAPKSATTLTFTADSTVPVGTYKLLVTGTSGSLTHAVNVTVAVIKPGFSIVANPNYLTVAAGDSNSTTIKVASLSRFNGTISPTTSSPDAVSPTLSSSSITVNTAATSATSTLTISASSTTAPGTYKVTVTGTAGSLIHSVTVNVKVVSQPTI